MKTLRNNTLITSLIGLVLILALIFTISMAFQTSETSIASADVAYKSVLISHDGEVYAPDENFTKLVDKSSYTVGNVTYNYIQDADGKWHMAEETLRNRYSGKTLVKIENGQNLKDFIASSENKVGYLVSDIEYNMQALNVIGSDKVFKGIFDGNGYKVNIISPNGGQELSYNEDYTGICGEFKGSGNIKGNYYSGMFCAINEGTIKNVNFVWNSNLTASGNVFPEVKDPTKDKGMLGAAGSIGNSESQPKKWTAVTGIIAGINYKGAIENCRLDIIGAFSVCKKRASANSLASNASYTGGICGANGQGGLIKRCTVNNEGGILGLSEGMTDGGNNNKALASTGGITGFIAYDTINTPKIQNCSLMGTGVVTAYVDPSEDVAYGEGATYAGGAVGSTVLIIEENIYNTKPILDENLNGLVSSWTGDATRIRWEKTNSRSPKTVKGLLFGDVSDGSTNSAVPKNMVLLFDIIALNRVDGGSKFPVADKPALDDGPISESRPQNIMQYGTWLGVYSTSDEGEVTAEYDYSRASDPIIIKAIANGFIDNFEGQMKVPNQGSRYYHVKEENSSQIMYGKMIFDAKYSTESYKDVNATKRIETSEFAGAEFARIDPSQKGTIEYNFGEIVQMEFISQNTVSNTEHYIHDDARRYNGQDVKVPTLKLTRANGTNVTSNTSNYELERQYQKVDDDGYAVGASLTPTNYKLPGIYSFKAKAADPELSMFAYYDETNRIVVAYDDQLNSNQYAIFIGQEEQIRIQNNTSEINFGLSDTITFGYLDKGAPIPRRFSYYTCSIQANSEDYQVMEDDQAYKQVVVNENGITTYFIDLYVDDPYVEGGKIKVGSINTITYVDIEAPEITNIKYYQIGETLDDLTQVYIEELTSGWTTSDLLIEYEVTDKGLSGIASGKGHKEVVKATNKWQCKLILDSAQNEKQVEYSDVNGNKIVHTFKFDIDAIPTQLKDVEILNSSDYFRTYPIYGFCPVEVKIGFTPVFGKSGATLQYSYQKNELGEDIWLNYEGELYSNQPCDFNINFDIDGSNFKMRLINNENLYSASYANGDGLVSNGLNGEAGLIWNVHILIAHIGITLDNIFYKDENNQDVSLGSVDNINKFFNKTYDGTNVATREFALKLYNGETNDLLNDHTFIIYADHYEKAAPKIQVNEIKITVVYESINATLGNEQTKVKILVENINPTLKKYEFYFIENGSDYLIYDDIKECPIVYDNIRSSIAPYVLTINLADYNTQLSTSYIYGQEVPSTLIVGGVNDEELELELTSATNDFKVTRNEEGIITEYPKAKTYSVNVNVDAFSNKNYRLIKPSSLSVIINPKAVAVKPMLDGQVEFSTTIPFNGLKHVLTATYEDVFGLESQAKVEYYTNEGMTLGKTAGEVGISELNTYYVKITVEDTNYVVKADETTKILKITKGTFKIKVGASNEQIHQFNNSVIDFKITPDGQYGENTYKLEDFTIKYYEIKGDAPDMTKELLSVKNVGRYLVKVSMAENKNYYAAIYDDSYLSITKASVTMTALESIEVTYTGELFGFDVLAAQLKVVADNSQTTVIGLADNTIKYFDLTGSELNTLDVLTSDVFEIWHNSTKVTSDNRCLYSTPGVYKYELVFKGDKNFNEASFESWLIINDAEFEGLYFNEENNEKTVNFTGDKFTFELERNEAFENYLAQGMKVYYKVTSGRKPLDISDPDYEPLETLDISDPNYKPLGFVDVGTYLITAIIELENYKSTQITAKLVVDKTAMQGISNVMMGDIVYDGKFHPAQFTGFDLENGKLKCEYLENYEEEGFIAAVYYKGERVTVDYDDNAAPIDVGTYSGIITFTSESYAVLKLKTMMTIVPQTIASTNIELTNKLFEGLTSKTDLSKLKTKFTTEQGEKLECRFTYYQNDKKVELSEDGTLPAGTYTVRIDFGNDNYVSTAKVDGIVISELSSGGSSGSTSQSGGNDGSGGIMNMLMDNIMYIGIGAGALVVIVTIAIVVSTKGKKKKRKGKQKNDAPKKQKPNKNVSTKDKATF